MKFPRNRLSPDELDREFGFDLEDDSWLSFVRGIRAPIGGGRIGPYEILGEAGRGGQGVVFRVRQPRTGRTIAIKRIAAGVFATPEMRARFEREIEAIAALDHPNIVRLLGSELVDGQPILAMQWIDGLPFDEWARPSGAPPRPAREVLETFVRACDALQHAHQRGLIHRDLKPSNVLIDAAGQPHVLDFGLAKLNDDSRSAHYLTLAGAFVGTPAFSAPEQLLGRPTEVDVRSDVYALGSMLYLAIAGRPVVDPKLPLAEIAAHARRAAALPELVVDGKTDRELEAILRKSVQPDKADRYGSVADFGADVRRYLAGEAVTAHPPSALYRFRKFVRRNSWSVGIATGVGLTLVAATIVSTSLYFQMVRERDAAQKARKEAQRKAEVNHQITDFMRKMYEEAGQQGQVAKGPLTVREMLNRASERINSQIDRLDPEVEASSRMVIGDHYRALGLDSQAAPHYAAAVELRRTALEPDDNALAESLDALARCMRRLGRNAEAETAMESAWAIRVRALEPRDPYFAKAANGLGLVKVSLAKLDDAERWYQEALRRYRDAFGPANESIPAVLSNIARVHSLAGRLPEAESLLREALNLGRAIHGDSPQENTAATLACLADVLARQGDRTGEAESMFATSIAQLRALFGESHPRIAVALERFAAFRADREEFETAKELLCQAIEIMIRTEHWHEAVEFGRSLAKTAARGDLLDGTIAERQVAVEFAQSAFENEPSVCAVHQSVLGQLLIEAGRLDLARTFLCEARERFVGVGSPAEAATRLVDALLARISAGDQP
ncbi:MAG: serine/threonine protein kinase [Phycisphaerales bacterium]|nr:serine/threonine protein kinase [Phycisphaerales bacterium]